MALQINVAGTPVIMSKFFGATDSETFHSDSRKKFSKREKLFREIFMIPLLLKGLSFFLKGKTFQQRRKNRQGEIMDFLTIKETKELRQEYRIAVFLRERASEFYSLSEGKQARYEYSLKKYLERHAPEPLPGWWKKALKTVKESSFDSLIRHPAFVWEKIREIERDAPNVPFLVDFLCTECAGSEPEWDTCPACSGTQAEMISVEAPDIPRAVERAGRNAPHWGKVKMVFNTEMQLLAQC